MKSTHSVMWSEIPAILKSHTHFVLTTHVNPDGDGIGAAAALTEMLTTMGKSVRFVCDSSLPEKFRFLDSRRVFERYNSSINYQQTEVLVVLDTHRKERIGRVAALLNIPNLTSICIDHHAVTETFTHYAAIDPRACSVGMMVRGLMEELGLPLTREAADGIYASLLCDTGRFSYSSTTREAHAVADECLSVGVDPSDIYGKLFQQVPLREIRMFSKVLNRLETHLDNKVAVQVVRKGDLGGESDELLDLDLEYIHEFTKMIHEVECVVLLRELPSKQVRVSCRSKNELDMGHIMSKIGGGGHSKAAGATWDGSVDEAKDVVLDLLRNRLLQSQI